MKLSMAMVGWGVGLGLAIGVWSGQTQAQSFVQGGGPTPEQEARGPEPESVAHAMGRFVRADDADVQFFMTNAPAIGDTNGTRTPYLEQLRAKQGLFTPEGWKSYLSALDNANIPTRADADHLHIITQQTGDAVIDQHGADETGRPLWRAHVPITRSAFTDPNTHTDQKGVLFVELVQTTLNGHIQPGLKVRSLVFKPN